MDDAEREERSSPQGDRDLPPLPGAMALISLGSTIAACVGLGVWLGIVVDGALGSSPAGLVVGLSLGVAAAVAAAIAQVRRFS